MARVLKEKEKKEKKERWAENPEKYKEEIDEEVDRLLRSQEEEDDQEGKDNNEAIELDEENYKLLKNVLKKTEKEKENKWVSIHEIEEFESDAYSKMIENRILERIGDSVKFSDDVVYNHLSNKLLNN